MSTRCRLFLTVLTRPWCRAYPRRKRAPACNRQVTTFHGALRSLAHALVLQSGEDGTVAVAIKTKTWTLEEVHSLPDDGNKYELVRGELFVTPPPNEQHESIAAKLNRILDPYVARHS